MLSKINVNKAIGPDEIHSWIIRDHALNLAHPIRTIFDASVREGYLPAIWRTALLFSSQRLNLFALSVSIWERFHFLSSCRNN